MNADPLAPTRAFLGRTAPMLQVDIQQAHRQVGVQLHLRPIAISALTLVKLDGYIPGVCGHSDDRVCPSKAPVTFQVDSRAPRH